MDANVTMSVSNMATQMPTAGLVFGLLVIVAIAGLVFASALSSKWFARLRKAFALIEVGVRRMFIGAAVVGCGLVIYAMSILLGTAGSRIPARHVNYAIFAVVVLYGIGWLSEKLYARIKRNAKQSNADKEFKRRHGG